MPRPVFYMKHEGISYWAVPAFTKWEGLDWMTFRDDKWIHDLSWDDIPKAVLTEYMLWLMNGKVDKH